MKTIYLLLAAMVFWSTGANSQSVINPSFGLTSHETLDIRAVEISSNGTVVHMTIVNMSASGYFCVDRNTYIVLPDGKRHKLIRADGIPMCPLVHNFRSVGEILSFTLHFPSVDVSPGWFNIIEECSENCFSIYGVTLDTLVNTGVEKAYKLADSGKPAEAAEAFGSLIGSIGNSRHGILGSLYSSVIVMCLRNGDEAGARVWYDKMTASGVPDLKLYIENLGSRGIKW
jgi:hypothetical protein